MWPRVAIRDLPIGEWNTWLVLPRARLRCARCGPTGGGDLVVGALSAHDKAAGRAHCAFALVTSLRATAACFRVSRDTAEAN